MLASCVSRVAVSPPPPPLLVCVPSVPLCPRHLSTRVPCRLAEQTQGYGLSRRDQTRDGPRLASGLHVSCYRPGCRPACRGRKGERGLFYTHLAVTTRFTPPCSGAERRGETRRGQHVRPHSSADAKRKKGPNLGLDSTLKSSLAQRSIADRLRISRVVRLDRPASVFRSAPATNPPASDVSCSLSFFLVALRLGVGVLSGCRT